MSSVGRRRALRDRSLTQDELAQLRQEAIENLGRDTRQTASDVYQGLGNFASFLKENPKSAVQLGALMSPDPFVGTAAGVAEAFGVYPDPFNPGENLPSVLEQLLEGEFLGAGLTTLGALPVIGAFASGVKNAKRISDATDADVLLEFEDLGGATVRLQPREDGTININELVSPERNKGNASEVLNRIHDKADEDGLSLVLTPERMQEFVDVPGTLDTDELIEFYRRKGYRVRFPDPSNPDQIPEMIRDPKVKPKPETKIKYNQKEKRILEGDGNTGSFLKMLFADDDTYVVDTFENYGVDADLRGPAKLPKGSTLRFRDKIYNQTQESLKDQPEKMLVYRHGKIGIPAHAGHPVSFTLAPFRGTLPSQGIDKNVKGVFLKEDEFEVYEVDKKDILANFEGVVPRYASSGAGHERELLIYPDKVRLASTDAKPAAPSPPMTEKQYNVAIGAAKGNKELQQRLIAEKNEFFPKKEKPKSTKPTKTPRQKAAEASRTSTTPGIIQGSSPETSGRQVFGEGKPGLVKYSTPTTRAFANMERPKQNMSGDALLNRLDISAMDESQSGIRSLIDEMGGLDNPNFIGDKGALITFDEFFDRLVEYGPRRSTIQHTNPEYARTQELNFRDNTDRRLDDFLKEGELPDGVDFSVVPHISRGLADNHRFAVLHTNDMNIPDTPELPETHRHYRYTKEPLKKYLTENSELVSHSRGGFYRMTNSKNPNDKDHLVVALDEFQTDGFKKVSESRGLISPEKIIKERKKLKERKTNFENRAKEINNEALSSFGAGSTVVAQGDEFVKDFDNIFRYRDYLNPFESGVVNRIRMDRFIKDIRKEGTPVNEIAREFFEKNPSARGESFGSGVLSNLFSRGSDIERGFDPSDQKFLREFLSSDEGFQALTRNTDVPGYQLARDVTDENSFSNQLRVYAKNANQEPGKSVIESLSKLIAKGDTDGFIGRAGLTPEKMDELAEAADQFDSLSKNIDDLDDVGALSRRKIIDRDVLEQRKKYLPIQNQLDEFEDTISKIDNAKNQMKKDRMDLFDAKMNERSVVFKSLEKLNGREFKRARKRQFEEIENALDELMSDSSNTRDALFIPDIFERDVKNLLKAFNASAPKALGGEYRASAQAFGGKYGSELEITLKKDAIQLFLYCLRQTLLLSWNTTATNRKT